MAKKNESLVVNAATGTAFTYRSAKAGDDIRRCHCGCGLQVVGKAIYRPGHDAKHVSELALGVLDALANGSKGNAFTKNVREAFAALLSPKLVVKLAARLMKSVDDRQAATVDTLAKEAIDALADEDEEGEEQ